MLFCMGTWADTTVTLVKGVSETSLSTGSISSNVFTTNATSGLAGVQLRAAYVNQGTYFSQRCMSLKPSVGNTNENIVLSAPAGYAITGVSITVQAHSSSYPYTMTVGGNTQDNITGASAYTFTANNLTAPTYVMVFKANQATVDWLHVKAMTVTVKRSVWVPTSRVTSFTTGTAYMMYDTHWDNNDNSNSRAGFVEVNGTAISKSQYLTPAKKMDFYGRSLWVIEESGTSGQYYLRSLNANNYYDGDATASSTKKAVQILAYSNASIVKPDGGTPATWSINHDGTKCNDATTDSEIWGIKHADGNTFWNGNPSGFATWTSAHPYAIYEVALKDAVYQLSDIKTTKTYSIMTPGRGWWAVGASATEVNSTHSNGLNLATDQTDGKQQFAFIQYNGHYYLYSVSEKKFAYVDGTKLSLSEDVDANVLASDVTFTASTNTTYNGGYPVVMTIGGKMFGIHPSKTPTVYNYEYSDDEGNSTVIVESSTFDPAAANAKFSAISSVDVTYNLIFQGRTIDTRIIQTIVNSTASSPWTAPAACTLTDVSDRTITEATTINITLTGESDIPFTTAASFSDVTWYYLKIRGKYAYYDSTRDGTNGYQATSTKAVAVATAENALWGFVGDPYHGILVVNKAAGEGKYLDSYNNSYPVMGSNDDNYSRWTYGVNDYGFTLHTGEYKYINDEGNKGCLGYWNNTPLAQSDAGSAITLDPVVYYDLALAYIDQYASDNAIASGYFGVLESGKTLYKNQITTSFGKTPATLTATVYENVVKPGCSAMISLPETGYYRLKNVNESTYFLGYDGTADAASSVCLRGMQDSNVSPRTIIHMVKDVDPSGNVTYQMSLQGTNIDAVSSSTKRTPSATAANYKPEYIQPGQGSFTTTSAGGTYLHCSASQQYALVGWNTGKNSPASKWIVQDVSSFDITMNDGGDDHTYATLYLPFGVTIDSESDVDAYIMTIVGEVASGTKIGKDIPANTGVILKGTAETESVTLTINDAATATTTDNDLEGTCVVKDAREGDEGVYDLVLGKGTTSNTLGFYLAPTGGKLAANKAYLPYRPAAVGARVNGFAIQWDDEVTGIRNIDNGKQSVKNGAIYDLSGRRVENPQRGMYIVNGRVVVVK